MRFGVASRGMRTSARRLWEALDPALLRASAEFGIYSDAKEAITFAILAYESFHGRPDNLPPRREHGIPAFWGRSAGLRFVVGIGSRPVACGLIDISPFVQLSRTSLDA